MSKRPIPRVEWECPICGKRFRQMSEATACSQTPIAPQKYQVGDEVFAFIRYPDAGKIFARRTIVKVLDRLSQPRSKGDLHQPLYVLDKTVHWGSDFWIGADEGWEVDWRAPAEQSQLWRMGDTTPNGTVVTPDNYTDD